MLGKIREYTVGILLILLIVFFGFSAEGFATWSNLFNLLRQVAVLGIVSIGMAIVIIAGGIDLSVGSLVSLVSCCTAILISGLKLPSALACLIGIAVSVAAMVLNGVVINFTGMPAMLCTLATLQIYQGLTYMVTGGTPVYGLPDSMRMMGQGYLWFIPMPVVLMVVLFLLMGMLLSYTYLGRYFYAVGSNEETARLSGIPVVKTKLLSYALCGLLVGIAACIQMSRLFGGFPVAGDGMEMEAVTAVVVGGVSFAGGKGKLSGVALGVLVMGVLSNGLGVMGTNTYTQMVFKGVVLVLVVGLDCYQQKRVKKSRRMVLCRQKSQ